jgi:hypothetical protein
VLGDEALERRDVALLGAPDEIFDLLRIHETLGPSPRTRTVSRASRGSLST